MHHRLLLRNPQQTTSSYSHTWKTRFDGPLRNRWNCDLKWKYLSVIYAVKMSDDKLPGEVSLTDTYVPRGRRRCGWETRMSSSPTETPTLTWKWGRTGQEASYLQFPSRAHDKELIILNQHEVGLNEGQHLSRLAANYNCRFVNCSSLEAYQLQFKTTPWKVNCDPIPIAAKVNCICFLRNGGLLELKILNCNGN